MIIAGGNVHRGVEHPCAAYTQDLLGSVVVGTGRGAVAQLAVAIVTPGPHSVIGLDGQAMVLARSDDVRIAVFAPILGKVFGG